jgi:hypothetical protein
MTAFDELTWHEAMRQGHATSLGEATQAQVWLALASELGSQGERSGHPGT